MKARQLIGSATFGPEALIAIGQAFDDAWQEIGPTISARPKAVEAARVNLANIVLSLANDGTRDSATLKDDAVRRFTLKRPIAS